MKAFLISTIFILFLFSSSKANASDYTIEVLVSSLPSTIETVIGASNLAETLPGARRDKFNLFCPLLPTLYYDDVYDLGPVGFLSSNSVSAFVQGYQILRPKPSEFIGFNYCAIYLIKPSKCSSLQRSLMQHAQKEPKSNSLNIWSFKDESKCAYFCFANKRILIFSTKKSFVLDIASRLRENRKSGILKSWREFHDINLKSNYFAVRHYQKKLNIRYWSDTNLAFVDDKDVIGFSFVSNSMEWKKAIVHYYSKKPSSIGKYLKSVMNSEDFPPGHTFQYRLLPNQNSRTALELTAGSEEARGQMYFIFSMLFGFVPV